MTPMQFNTALCFFFKSGISFILKLLKNQKLHKVSRILNYFVGTISLLTLLQYFTNLNFGIDEILFNHTILTNTFHKGRMAQDTAIAFIIFSHVLSIDIKNKKQKDLHNTLSFLVFILRLLNIFTYIFDLGLIVRLSFSTNMAFHTSVCFMILGISLIIYNV